MELQHAKINMGVIYCIINRLNGKLYVGIKQAARALDVKYQNISAHVNKKINKNGKLIAPTVGGYTFSYFIKS